MKKYVIILIISLIISLTIINKNKLIEIPLAEEYIGYFVDGEETNTMPAKGSYDVSITCDKGASATWDYDNWGITIHNATQTGTRCSVTFISKATNIPKIMDNSLCHSSITSGGYFETKFDATGDNIVWSASDLPDGLTIDSNTGIISGNAKSVGLFSYFVTATNASGSDTVSCELNVTSSVITPPLIP